MNSFLRDRASEGFRQRMGARMLDLQTRARRQIERELALIEKLKLCGIFLIVWDLIRSAASQNILVRGADRPQTAPVCYSLALLIRSISMELLFEVFFPRNRRCRHRPRPAQRRRARKSIQYVYRRYGERGAAMTANVITLSQSHGSARNGQSAGMSDPETLAKFRRGRYLGISR